MIRRLLDEYHYPPDGQEEALTTVMEQCELWADYVMDKEESTYRIACGEGSQSMAAEDSRPYGYGR